MFIVLKVGPIRLIGPVVVVCLIKPFCCGPNVNRKTGHSLRIPIANMRLRVETCNIFLKGLAHTCLMKHKTEFVHPSPTCHMVSHVTVYILLADMTSVM